MWKLFVGTLRSRNKSRIPARSLQYVRAQRERICEADLMRPWHRHVFRSNFTSDGWFTRRIQVRAPNLRARRGQRRGEIEKKKRERGFLPSYFLVARSRCIVREIMDVFTYGFALDSVPSRSIHRLAQTLTRIDESRDGERVILLDIAYRSATRYVSSRAKHDRPVLVPRWHRTRHSHRGTRLASLNSEIVEFALKTRTRRRMLRYGSESAKTQSSAWNGIIAIAGDCPLPNTRPTRNRERA